MKKAKQRNENFRLCNREVQLCIDKRNLCVWRGCPVSAGLEAQRPPPFSYSRRGTKAKSSTRFLQAPLSQGAARPFLPLQAVKIPPSQAVYTSAHSTYLGRLKCSVLGSFEISDALSSSSETFYDSWNGSFNDRRTRREVTKHGKPHDARPHLLPWGDPRQ